MTEKINVTYKPSELVAAQQVLIKQNFTPDEASSLLVALHKAGYRLVKCN